MAESNPPAPDILIEKALIALEDAVTECRYRQPRRSYAIKFALYYLWFVSGGDRKPFDDLWRSLGSAKSPWSFSVANTDLLGIYRALNVERDPALEAAMWKRWSLEQGSGGPH